MTTHGKPGQDLGEMCSPMRRIDESLLARQTPKRNKVLLLGFIFLICLAGIIAG